MNQETEQYTRYLFERVLREGDGLLHITSPKETINNAVDRYRVRRDTLVGHRQHHLQERDRRQEEADGVRGGRVKV